MRIGVGGYRRSVFSFGRAVACLWLTALLALGADLDSLVKTLREQHFKESTHGVPGISADQVDEDFVARLYNTDQEVAKALGKILAKDNYKELNRRIGEIRNQVNLEVWADIVREYAIRVELNNSGKMGGAISDLDQTHFSDIDEIVDAAGNVKAKGGKAVHKFLKHEFKSRFQKRMKTQLNLEDAYDMMHFSGDDMMAGWRMSKLSSADFLIRLNKSIANLANQPGAYFIPGAYKTQVYTRYLNEGRTIVIDGSIRAQGGEEAIPGYGTVKMPPGVALTYGETRKLSRLYKNVPISHDRMGVVGAIVENDFHQNHTANQVKQMKYGNRVPDTALVAMTNLQTDFRHLVLEGREGARKHFVGKLFGEFQDNLPPNLENVKEIQRVFELQQRIELDKVLRTVKKGERPDSWTGYWKGYESRDITDTDTKLEYFKKEADEIIQALEPMAEDGVDMTDPDTRRQIAELAEGAFFQKVKSIHKLAAAKAARKIYNKVFTKQGYTRLKHLVGPQKAQNLLTERVKELHAMLVMTDDPELLQTVVDQVPAESREAIKTLQDIARAQRVEVQARQAKLDELRKANPKATLEILRPKDLAQSNKVLFDLMHQLNLPDFDPNYRAGQTSGGHEGVRSLRSFAPRGWLDRHVAILLNEATIARYRNGETIKSLSVGKVVSDPGGTVKNVVLESYAHSADRARVFFNSTLPALSNRSMKLHLKDFGKEYAGSFLDLGTVESGVKITSAYFKGDTDAMKTETRDMLIGAIPYGGGKAFSIAKNLKDFQMGKKTPLMLFLTEHGLKLIPRFGGSLAGAFGTAVTLYNIGNELVAFHWEMYGVPSQMGGVSYILTGERDVVPIQRDAGNAFMNFTGSPTERILKGNALLDKLVPVPDLPREYREGVLRNLFLANANHEAWNQLDPDVPAAIAQRGENSAWHVAREKVLRQDYFTNWRYWFQRVWFYHKVYPQVFKAMRGQPLEVWAGFGDKPPPEIASLPEAERKRRFGSAYDKASKVWDYEKVYTRLYFRDRVADWEKGLDQGDIHVRRFYTALEDRGGPHWRDAVVDEMMKYYLEGEAFFSANPNGFERPKPNLDPQQARMQANYERGMRETNRRMMNSIASENAGKGRGRIEQIEGLNWHPAVMKQLEEGVLRAAERLPDYQPEKPQVLLRIPNNVARVGKDMKVEALLKGDTATMPEDVQFKVEYRPVTEHKGSRPDAVLDDDLLLAFGKVLPDDDLLVAEHEATLTAFSPSDSNFKATDKQTVYWLGRNPDKDDPNAAGLGEDGPGDEPDGPGLVSEVDGNADRGVAAAQDAHNTCQAARESIAQAASLSSQVAGLLKQAAARLAELEAQIKKAEAAVRDLAKLQGEVGTLAGELAKIRDPLGQAALKTCELTQKLKAAESLKERESLYRQVVAAFNEASQLHDRAKDAYLNLRLKRAAAQKLSTAMDEAESLVAGLEELFGRIDTGLAELETQVAASGELAGRVSEKLGEADKMRAATAALAGKVRGAETRGLVEAELGRINSAMEVARNCSDELAEMIDGLQTDLDRMKEERAKLGERFTQNRKSLGQLQAQTFDARLRDLMATADAADLLWESIAQYYNQARHCMQLARDIYQQPMMIPVPQLVGTSALSAKEKLDKLGLKMSPSGGDAPPKPELAHKVASQTPPGGGDIEAGGTVRVVIYSAADATVPDVAGMTVGKADEQLERAGLKGSYRMGSIAPSSEQDNRVVSQNPAAGKRLRLGSSVSVVLYRPYAERFVTVPPVVGYLPEEARDILRLKSLKGISQAGQPAPSLEAEGRVYRQEPPPGAKLAIGNSVKIEIYGKYEAPAIAVPSVHGLGQQEAANRLTGQGLRIVPQANRKPAPGAAQSGKAFAQKPVAGEKVAAGTSVYVSFYGRHKPAEVTRPAPTPTPTPRREPPPPKPQPQQATAFVVVFDLYNISNLAELLGLPLERKPGKTRMELNSSALDLAMHDEEKNFIRAKADAVVRGVRSLDSRRMATERNQKLRLAILVSAGGLQYYTKSDFKPGQKFSTPVKIAGRNNQNGRNYSFSGYFLLTSAELYDSQNAFQARYPLVKFGVQMKDGFQKKMKVKVLPFSMTNTNGTGSLSSATQQGAFTYSVGPVQKGWPAKALNGMANLQAEFTRACASDNAFLDRPSEGRRVLATLRRFRDRVLRPAPGGQGLIGFYYGSFSRQTIGIMERWPESRPAVRAALTLAADAIEAAEAISEASAPPSTLARRWP